MPTESPSSSKECLVCGKKTTWSHWFCPSCGGRLTYATHEAPKQLPGLNVLVTIMNSSSHDIVLDVPPKERIRLEPGQLKAIPSGFDQNVLIKLREDGTITVATRMYAEEEG